MDKAKYDDLIDLVLNKNILAENGVFILEHQSRQKFEHPNLQETRKYGNVSFSFSQKQINNYYLYFAPSENPDGAFINLWNTNKPLYEKLLLLL